MVATVLRKSKNEVVSSPLKPDEEDFLSFFFRSDLR